MTTPTIRICGECGKPLAADGDCPVCAIKQALALSAPGSEAQVIEQAGDRIGRYKLLEKIGEGGYGSVYMAEQAEPIRRRVALKIVKLGMDTKQVIARFEAERQALALMDHPSIAKVLDAGATDTGRPYFVMELVRGIKITDYCDQHSLSTKERLDLFIQVCHAVQHAHQKGIIHRDLKPSNVLVTQLDGRPLPKVIDFGIAKATGQQLLTDKTLFTAFQQFIGTPAYMSPEQAELSGTDVDTRSDIYALGVLLYELLTGRLPFDQKELLEAGLDEMRRIIREKEPPKPSTRLSTLNNADLSALAKRHQVEALKLIHLLRGDLDWIVMKCLEKERARRYETAVGLAHDIERHLNDEPVTARSPGSLYRFQKMVRRNKRAFVAAGAVMAALMIGLGLSSWLFLKEKNARQRAVAAERSQRHSRQKAEQERKKAQDLAEQNRQNLYAARINLAHQAYKQGSMIRAREWLDSLRPHVGEEDLRGFEWYYLHRLLHTERLQLHVHTNGARAVAFSPDGKIVATGDEGSKVILWNPASGLQLRMLSGHTGTVHAVAFSPSGEFLASGADDRLVKIWRVEDGREMATLAGHSNKVSAVAFSPNGKILASATGRPGTGWGYATTRFAADIYENVEVRLWDPATRKALANLTGHRNGVMAIAFSPDGQTLATASADSTVRLWKMPTGENRLTFTKHRGAVYALSFSRDGKRLVSSGHDQTAMLWEAADGRINHVFRAHDGPVFSAAFSPDGNSVATGGYDNLIKLWDVATGSERACFRGQTRYIWAIAFSPDSQTIATASWDGTVNLWDATRQGEFDIFRAKGYRDIQGAFYSLAFSANGKSLLAGDGRVRIWHTDDLTEQFQSANFHFSDTLVRYLPDGQSFVSADNGGVLRIFDAATKKVRFTVQAATVKIWALAVFPDSRIVVTGDASGKVKFWNINTATNEFTLPKRLSFVRSIAISPDGKTLALLGWNESDKPVLCFWDVATRRIRRELSLRSAASFVVFAPDGKTFAVGQRSVDTPTHRVITFWDALTERIRATSPPQSDLIFNAAFSPDSKTLATAAWDGTVRLWHVATGLELLTLQGHTMGAMFCVAFSPDGRQLAAGTGRDMAGKAIVRWLAQTRSAAENAPGPVPPPTCGP